MARIRTIKPAFWEDELLGVMPPVTRLTFIGLFSLADDEGRLRGNPVGVLRALFAYDESITVDVITETLMALHNLRRIRIYGNAQQRYIQVLNFAKHQRVDRPQPSQLPAPGPHYPALPVEGANKQDILDVFDTPTSNDLVRKGREGNGNGVEEALSSVLPDEPPSSIEKVDPIPSSMIVGVFDAWCEKFNRNANTKLDDKRRARIRWALKTYGRDVVWQVLVGYASDPWRHEATSRNEIRTLFRDAATVERGLELYAATQMVGASASPGSRNALTDMGYEL